MFSPPIVAVVFLIAAPSFWYFLTVQKAGSPRGEVAILLAICIPIMVFPYAIYLAGLVTELCSSFFNESGSMGSVRSYDLGDAAMARKDYGQAARFYRADLNTWPDDTDALIRLSGALEANGELTEAAQELNRMRQALLDGPLSSKEALENPASISPANSRVARYERILATTMRLGDLYVGPMRQPQWARRLYEETLERMYGFRGVEPIRERLRRLPAVSAHQGSSADANTSIVPDSLPLD